MNDGGSITQFQAGQLFTELRNITGRLTTLEERTEQKLSGIHEQLRMLSESFVTRREHEAAVVRMLSDITNVSNSIRSNLDAQVQAVRSEVANALTIARGAQESAEEVNAQLAEIGEKLSVIKEGMAKSSWVTDLVWHALTAGVAIVVGWIMLRGS